ncbi:MAG: hypothetical protein J5803_04495 [Desulfovibrio sp.]|nr:hypothetical protein [Desulfovibrio sp.]
MQASPRTSSKGFVCLLLVCLMLTACQDLFQQKRKHGHDARNHSVVFLLPASGAHAGIASKIIQGAQAAKKELEASGALVELALIDTNKPDWLTKLRALPERFTVLGGPLEPGVYNTLKQSGILEQKVLFAFLNNLNGQDEGRIAWRFFPSPQDQVEALTSFAQDKLGIRSFGAFYGNDPYSQKMVSVFEASLHRRNLPLQKVSFVGQDSASLSRQAKLLINPIEAGEGSMATPIPQTSFEAVFLPASWRQLNAIIQSFMYHGEDRLVLLGTMLWEQSLSGKRLGNPEQYELVVFPAAWNNQAQVAALQHLGRDFWTSLGYDFLHFAMNSGIVDKATPSEITAKANRASTIVRTLAPIHWDAQGIAHQKLFLYRASVQGMTRMDVQIFNQIRAKRKEKAALRMQGGQQETPGPQEEVLPKITPSVSEESPQPQPKPALSTAPSIPNSSYKLRLPARTTNP